MPQTNLHPVRFQVLPRHLPRIVREQDNLGILKIWLLDDMTPDDVVSSPLQSLLSSQGGRRWIHETTGGLVQVFYLAAPPSNSEEAPPEGDPWVYEVLTRKMSYTLAVQDIARQFRVPADRLPVMVGYISLDLDAFFVVSFGDIDNARELKKFLAAVFESLKTAARETLGSARIDNLLRLPDDDPVKLSEARRLFSHLATATARRKSWQWCHGTRSLHGTLERISSCIVARNATSPDYLLQVSSKEHRGDVRLSFSLEGPGTGMLPGSKDFGYRDLHQPDDYLWGLLSCIEDMDPAADGIEERLHGLGTSLSKIILPQELYELLGDLAKTSSSLLILTDNPSIPWELFKVRQGKFNLRIRGQYLAEAFAMTRWLPDSEPALALPLSEIAYLPGDGLVDRLSPSEDLRPFLASRAGRLQTLEASARAVVHALSADFYDTFHFAGHGVSMDGFRPDRWSLLLKGSETLIPDDLEGLDVHNRHPLVFLNACQSARSGPGLSGPAGWAPTLLKIGAGAFVGTLWSVAGKPASGFARTFYEELLAGKTIGEAVRRARLDLYKRSPKDPTWLAYTAFAHPLAKR